MILLHTTVSAQDFLFGEASDYSNRAVSDTITRPLLKDALKDLRQQTRFYFLYSEETIGDIPVNNISNKTGSAEFLLQLLLAGTALEYKKVSENTFAIVTRDDSRKPERSPGTSETNAIDIFVVDPDGRPLAGAYIMLKGATKGFTCDINGRTILPVKKGDRGTVSYVGFATKEVIFTANMTVQLDFHSAVHDMNEVTVTALGLYRSPKSLGYATSIVEGEKLVLVKENNIGNTLTGMVAGLNSSSPLTGPGASSRVTIRGNSSLTFDNQPLYIVNGIPINNDNMGNAGKYGGADFGDGISSINTDDIDQLTILKGGASAALYGQRGRNGVILISTKTASPKQKIEVTFNSNTQIDLTRDLREFQNEYGQGLYSNRPTDKASSIHSGLYSWGQRLDGELTPVFDGSLQPYIKVSQSSLNRFYRAGLRTQQTASISSSGENAQWRISLGDLRSEAVYPQSGYDRSTFNTDIRYKPFSKFSGHTYFQYSKEKGRNRPNINDAPGNGNYAIFFLPPNVDAKLLKPGFDNNGAETIYNDNAFHTNPFFAASRFRNNTDRNRIWGTTRLKFQWRPWLYLQGRVAHDYFTFTAKSITPTGTAYKPSGTINLERNFQYNETNIDFLLNVERKIGKHFFYRFLTGSNFLIMRSNVLDISADGLAFPFIYSQANASTTNINTLTPRKNVHSLYSSLHLAWKQNIFLTLTDRQDWSSTLPVSRNSYNYPSASLSWMPAPLFKWRLAFSRVGGDAPLFATSLYYNTTGTINGNPIGNIDNQIPSHRLEPLQIREWETGFVTDFANKRISVDFSLYHKLTLNDIVATSSSVTSGYTSAIKNIGRMQNKGMELQLTANPNLGTAIKWTGMFNIAFNQNKIINLSESQKSVQLWNGESRTERAFIHHVLGLPFAQIMAFEAKTNETGVPVVNQNGIVSNTYLSPMGTSIHPVTGGFANQISWRNWSMNLLIDFKFGGHIYSGTYATAIQRGLDRSTLYGREGGVRVEGVDANDNHISVVLPAQQYYEALSKISAHHVQKADFIKFRSFSLTHRFAGKWLPKSISGFQASLVGRNWFFLHRRTKHIDPEANYSNGNAQGLEYGSLPPARSIGLHLQIVF